MSDMSFELLVQIWNNLGEGFFRKSIKPEALIRNKLFKKRIAEAFEDIPDSETWNKLILYIRDKFENDDFWSSRRGMQGLDWLFQYRGGGRSGVPNYIHFYEEMHSNSDINEAKRELHNKLFG